MERTTWTVDVDGARHVLALDWTYYGGRRRVSIDSLVVEDSTIPFRWRSEAFLDLSGHAAVVRTKPARPISPYFRIELEVDGHVVEPDPGRQAFWET